MRPTTSQKDRTVGFHFDPPQPSTKRFQNVRVVTEESFQVIVTPKAENPKKNFSLRQIDLYPNGNNSIKQVLLATRAKKQKLLASKTPKQNYQISEKQSNASSSKAGPMIKSSLMFEGKTTVEPTIATASARTNSDFSRTLPEGLMRFSNIGNPSCVKTEGDDIEERPIETTEVSEEPLSTSPNYYSNQEKYGTLFKKELARTNTPNSYGKKTPDNLKRSWTVDREYNAINLRVIVQDKYNKIKGEKLLTDDDVNPLDPYIDSDKEINTLLDEGNIISTKRNNRELKVQISRRNKDTSKHFWQGQTKTPSGFNSAKSTAMYTTKTDRYGFSAFSKRNHLTDSINDEKDLTVSQYDSSPNRKNNLVKNHSTPKTTKSLGRSVTQKPFNAESQFLISSNYFFPGEDGQGNNKLMQQSTMDLKLKSFDRFSPKAAFSLSESKKISTLAKLDTIAKTGNIASIAEISSGRVYPPYELNKIDQNNLMKKSDVYNQRLYTHLETESGYLRDEVQEMIKKVTMKLERNRMPRQEEEDEELEAGAKRRRLLDELDINILKEEFRKKAEHPEEANYEKIDSMIMGLKFFSKLAKSIRFSLLRHAQFVHYESGTTLFKKGDYGDNMYIILRGSVNVRATVPSQWGPVDDVIVGVIYDGFHFGDYALMGTNQKNKNRKKSVEGNSHLNIETGENQMTKEIIRSATRQATMLVPQEKEKEKEKEEEEDNSPAFKERTKRTATVIAAESCDLLAIPRRRFQDILLNLIQRDLDAKVQILLCLSFFSKSDPYTLIPIANNLVPKVYQMGDIIVRGGEELDRFVIVSSGRCKVVHETITKIDANSKLGLRRTITPLRNLDTGKNDYTCPETAEKDKYKEETNVQQKNHVNLCLHSTKSFDQEKIGVVNDILYYKDHIQFQVLTRGDSFGGRALLSKEDINVVNDPFKKMEKIGLPAQLSVIADSAIVEVFELDKEHLDYIPNFLTKLLLQGLKTVKEFDEYDMTKEKKELKAWADFRGAEFNKVLYKKQKGDPTYYKKF